jgi:hypothetical protein
MQRKYSPRVIAAQITARLRDIGERSTPSAKDDL